MCLCLLFLSMILFMRHFLPPCEISEGLSSCDSSIVFLSATEKCNSENINLVLFMISIITVFVKLLQMIWGCVIRFAVGQSVCMSHLPVYPECLSLGEASKRGWLGAGDWKKLKFQMAPKLKGETQDVFLRGDLKYKGRA